MVLPRIYQEYVDGTHELNGNGTLQMTDGKGNIHFDMSLPKAANMNEQGGAPGRNTEDAMIGGPPSNQDLERDDPSMLKE